MELASSPLHAAADRQRRPDGGAAGPRPGTSRRRSSSPTGRCTREREGRLRLEHRRSSTGTIQVRAVFPTRTGPSRRGCSFDCGSPRSRGIRRSSFGTGPQHRPERQVRRISSTTRTRSSGRTSSLGRNTAGCGSSRRDWPSLTRSSSVAACWSAPRKRSSPPTGRSRTPRTTPSRPKERPAL